MNIYHENFTFLLEGLRSESATQQCRSSRDPNEIAIIDFELQYCLKIVYMIKCRAIAQVGVWEATG